MPHKRSVPSSFRCILDIDTKLTSIICNLVSKCLPTRNYTNYYKGLEYSCHGIVWIACWMTYIWFIWSRPLFQMQVNFIIGLFIDLFAVAIIKAFIRRRRPVGNKKDQWAIFGPDKYSFPSGHVSRAFFIVFFFSKLHPLSEFMVVVIYIWAIAVAFSRILLRRHHLLDVIAGSMLGYLISLIVSIVWINQDTAEYIISYISDDVLEGGEYHV